MRSLQKNPASDFHRKRGTQSSIHEETNPICQLRFSMANNLRLIY